MAQGIEYNFVFMVDMINASNFVHDDLLMQELIFVVMINAVLSSWETNASKPNGDACVRS